MQMRTGVTRPQEKYKDVEQTIYIRITRTVIYEATNIITRSNQL